MPESGFRGEAARLYQQFRRGYRAALQAASFRLSEQPLHHVDGSSLTRLVGSLPTAFPADALPPPERGAEFGEQVQQALGGADAFEEPVHVRPLLAEVG